MAESLAIDQVRVPKASDILAERLRRSILTGELAEGASLPTERDLVERSGLSRASVREALRILEVQGLIQTRPGRNGGSVVRRPARESIERAVSLFIRSERTRLAALLETREAIEPAVARLAALNRTEADLAELKSAHDRLIGADRDEAAFLIANIDWHLAVTRASHNELLVAFMSAISQEIHAGTDIEDFDSDEVRAATLRAHERIMAAIVNADPEAATRRMLRHVRAYSSQASRATTAVEVAVATPPPAAARRKQSTKGAPS